MAYEVEFYFDRNGKSELVNYLNELDEKYETSKDARIKLSQIRLCIKLLTLSGFNQKINILKKLKDDIWELRPGDNRILLFYYSNNKFVLLHHFMKKTNKTPEKEIEKAIREKNDYIERNLH